MKKKKVKDLRFFISYFQDFDRGTRIYTSGCIPKGEEWLESNIAPVAGVAVGLGTLQILGICFAQSLRAEIHAQRAKWTL